MAKSSAEEVDQKTEKNETIAKTTTVTTENSEKCLDSIDTLIEHPLQNAWSLWYFEIEKGKSWEACQHRISKFDTVEGFWSLFNHIKSPTEINNGSDYSLFKNSIRPMWEDEQNKNGGRWLINLQKFFRPSDVDRLWLEVILCLIGEAFEYSEDICGAVVNIRPKGHKIAIWTSNNNQARIMSIGAKMREVLKLPEPMKIQYEFHKEAAFRSKTPAFTL